MKNDNRILSRKLVQSYLSSIISISLVLLLVGIFGFLAVNARSVSDYFRENIKLSVIFESFASEDEAKAVFSEIRQKPYVKEAIYISKEDGAVEMKDMLGEDFLEIFEVNPIPISIDLFLKADYLDNDSLITIEDQLVSLRPVREVAYQDSLVKLINENMEKIGIVTGIFILLLLFISIVLINNTVRLNLFSKRFIVYTMKLVGAKRSFIRKPFLSRAIIQGFFSGVISSLLLSGLIYFIYRDLPELFIILDIETIGIVLAGIIIIGMLMCLVSTYLILNRLVSMTGDDIYY